MYLNAVSAIKAVLDELFSRIYLIKDYISIAFVAGSESNDLKVLGHPFKEADGVGADGDVGLGDVSAFHLYGQDNIVRFRGIFFAVNYCFINVDQQCFLVSITFVPREVYFFFFDLRE